MERANDAMAPPPWNPDCLDRFLGCWKGSPKTVAATGYYMLRILYSVLVVHSGIIFAGVITYAALKHTHCLSSNDDDGGSCASSDKDDGDDGRCEKLWGLIKPDSLLTVIGTAAAIVVALTAALVGTLMDITPYRRQLGLAGYVLAMVGLVFCLAIGNPTEDTLVVCSIGLVLIIICKAYVLLQVDSYGPELSPVHAEVGSAISGAFTWSLITNVLLVIIWSVIGMGLANSTFGVAVTIGSIILLALASLVTYRRLPDVPAAHKLPSDSNVIKYTFHRFATLIWETYHKYPDLGLLILSGMIFDPALTAIFSAAVAILISKYNFTADQVTLILGFALIAAIPSVPLSRWVASTPKLSWLFNDAADTLATFSDDFEPQAPVGPQHAVELQTVTRYTTVPVQPVDAKSASGSALPAVSSSTALMATAGEGDLVKQSSHDTEREHETPNGPVTTTITTNSAEMDHHATVFHAHRVRAALIVSLALTIIVTILVVQVLTPCNFGLASLFACLWGFLLSYSWKSHSMLRMAVVPGGRESEFAGLYLAVYSSMIWLPLFVFSVANEVWNIDGALYILTIFLGIGGIILFFVNLERGLLTRLKSLDMRRWAHVLDIKVQQEEEGVVE